MTTTTTTRIPLATARQAADKLVARLAPFCERIEIAGSIRRQKPDVGDIELVAVPRTEQRLIGGQLGLFDGSQKGITEAVSLLDQELERMITARHITKDGPRRQRAWGPRMKKFWIQLSPSMGLAKVDLFITQRDSWGPILTSRTGPNDFSRELVTHIALKTPYRQQDGRLIHETSGAVIPVPTEEAYFEYACVPFIPPERRTVQALKRAAARWVPGVSFETPGPVANRLVYTSDDDVRAVIRTRLEGRIADALYLFG